MSRPRLDLTGHTYRNFTVLSKKGNKWLCECICGNQLLLETKTLRQQARKSCGCIPQRKQKLYMLYNYDRYVMEGTIEEIAKYAGLAVGTAKFYVYKPSKKLKWEIVPFDNEEDNE